MNREEVRSAKREEIEAIHELTREWLRTVPTSRLVHLLMHCDPQLPIKATKNGEHKFMMIGRALGEDSRLIIIVSSFDLLVSAELDARVPVRGPVEKPIDPAV